MPNAKQPRGPKIKAAVSAAAPLAEDYERRRDLLWKGIGIALLEKTFDAIFTHADPKEAAPWHKMALEQMKLGARMGAAESPLTERERQERIWDVFGLPESERAKRRAAGPDTPAGAESRPE